MWKFSLKPKINEWLLISIVLFLITILFAVSLNSYPALYGDNAVFIILAKSMLTQGKYSHIAMLYESPHTQFPFVFPVLLIPIIAIFGINILAIKILVTIMAIASIFFIWYFFKIIEESSPILNLPKGCKWNLKANNIINQLLSQPLLIALLSGVSPFMGEFTHKEMSEYPYVFFSFLAIIFLTRYHKQKKWLTKTGISTAILITISYFTRSIGLVIFLGGLLYIFLDGISKQEIYLRIKKALLIFLIFIIAASAWEYRNQRVSNKEKPDYVNQFFMKDPYNRDLGAIGIGDLANRVWDNYNRYISVFSNVIVNHRFKLEFLNRFLPDMIFCLLIFGYIYCLIKRRTIVEYVFTIYIIVVYIWPWSGVRFIMPVIPFLLYYAVISMRVFLSFTQKSIWGKFIGIPILHLLLLVFLYSFQTQIQPRHFVPVMYLIFSLCLYGIVLFGNILLKIPVHLFVYIFIILLIITVNVYSTIDLNVKAEHQKPYYRGQWGEYYDIAQWIKANTTEDNVIMSRKPELTYLWTNRKQVIYPFTHNKSAVMDSIFKNKVDYVVLDTFTWTKTTPEYLIPAMEEQMERFSLVYQAGKSKVYKVSY